MIGKTWKEQKIDYHRFEYGDYVKQFESFDDDRRIYENTYNMILGALDSLEDEPPVYVRVAMNKAIEKDYEMLDAILARFI